MSQAHSWVQFSQWVQHGCSAVPAAAAQAQLRHREPFSRKSSTQGRSDGTGSELVVVLVSKSIAIEQERAEMAFEFTVDRRRHMAPAAADAELTPNSDCESRQPAMAAYSYAAQ